MPWRSIYFVLHNAREEHLEPRQSESEIRSIFFIKAANDSGRTPRTQAEQLRDQVNLFIKGANNDICQNNSPVHFCPWLVSHGLAFQHSCLHATYAWKTGYSLHHQPLPGPCWLETRSACKCYSAPSVARDCISRCTRRLWKPG
jgi:hypothetical protein